MGRILEIYAIARDFMRHTGNPTQWGNKNPPQAMLEADINAGQLYVCEDNGEIYGVFAFIIGDDPAYAVIEDGAWGDNSRYGTIHRLASSGTQSGVFGECMAYCAAQINHLRIDTHQNNKVMQHLIAKHGFTRRGIVHMADGSPRIAYELTQK